ncbi:hypothetical protein Tco_0688037 [Tanacetum coccineum]
MAALKYRDEHNKIGFLEKPKGSTDYHQVIDFLLDSHIRCALVTDPLIYDSLITQFWSTASLRSSKLGPPAIVATIDGTFYTITESLVGDEAVHKELGDIMERAVTTASSLEAEQESGNINKTQSMATLNGSSP